MAFTSSSNEVEIQINANDNASKDISGVQGKLSGLRQAAGAAGAAMAGLGAIGMGAAIKQASKFEEAMVEVQKVTNKATAEKLNEDIREMAETIPLAQEELANISADAARFGIRGSENIRAFTDTVSKMSVATDLSANEAGQALAKLGSMLDIPAKKMENLSSSINALSNNFATSSSEIVDSMMRSSSTLKQLGMGKTEIAGLSAAMNAVSESARRAGSRMRRLGQEMMSPKKVAGFANALGMTESQFKKLRDNNPNKAIRMMAKAMKDGGKSANTLKNTLSTTSRQALAAMAGSLDKVTKAQQLANDEFQKGTSSQEEFEAASDTFNAKMQLLRNRLNNVAITIGNTLIPYVLKAVNAVMPLVEAFANLNQRTNGMAGAITLLGTTIAGLVTAFAAFSPVIMGSVVPALGTVATVMTGPVGLAIAGLVAAIAGLNYAWQNNLGGIRDATKKLVSTIRSAFTLSEGRANKFRNAISTISSQISVALNKVKAVFRFVFRNFVVPLMNEVRSVIKSNLGDIITEFVQLTSKVSSVLKTFGQWFSTFWNAWGDEIMLVAKSVFGQLKLVISTALDAIMTTIKVVLALIQGDWKSALGYIEGFATRTFDRIVSFVRGSFLGGLRAAMDMIVAAIKWPFEQLYNFLIGNSLIPEMFNGIVSFIRTTFFGGIKSTFNRIFQFYKGIWNRIWSFYQGIWNSIYNTTITILTKVYNGVKKYINFVLDIYRTVFTTVFNFTKDTFRKIKTAILDTIRTIGNWLSSGGMRLIKGGFNAIKDAATNVVDAMSEAVMNTVSSLATDIVDTIVGAANDAIDRFNSMIPDSISIPSVTIGGGSVSLPSTTIAGETIGGGSLSIPSETVGGQSINMPQLAEGGLVTDATMAMIGEGVQTEAVMPLDKLDSYIDTAYDAGSSDGNGGQMEVTLRVEGDDELTRLIRENAEAVVSNNEESRQDRYRRL